MAMCALPGVNDVPIFATVVHLVLSEWLPIWLFYFANYTLMTETTSYLYLWYTDVELSDLSDWMATLSSKDAKRVENLGEYVFCVQNEMNIASWSFDLSYKGNCVSLRGGYNLLAVANYISLLLCCGVVVSSLCLILWNDGSDICTGRYLATKWRYEKTRLFHCLAVMLLVLVVAGFLVTAIVSGATLKSQTFGQLFEAWFFYGSLETIVLLCSAYALLPSWSPRFDYDGEDFQRLRFRRTWRHVFWISSQEFARDLEEAILLAGCGKWKRLREALEDPDQAEEVLQICRLLDEEVCPSSATSTDASEASDCEDLQQGSALAT